MTRRIPRDRTVRRRLVVTLGVVLVSVVVAAVACVGSTTPGPPQVQPLGNGGGWRLVFSDEFTEGALDASKWSTGWFGDGVTGPVRPTEQACYDPANVAIRPEQQLAITLERRAQECAGRVRPWTTGLVSTNGHFDVTYGMLEARLYLPGDGAGGVANWPAFWANGQNWPHDGENDVVESLDGAVGPHFHSPSGGPGFRVPGNWSGWHTFGADWQPGRVVYYYDGRPVGVIAEGITDSPMHLILGYGPSENSPTLPASMLVDYVRVWQR